MSCHIHYRAKSLLFACHLLAISSWWIFTERAEEDFQGAVADDSCAEVSCGGFFVFYSPSLAAICMHHCGGMAQLWRTFPIYVIGVNTLLVCINATTPLVLCLIFCRRAFLQQIAGQRCAIFWSSKGRRLCTSGACRFIQLVSVSFDAGGVLNFVLHVLKSTWHAAPVFGFRFVPVKTFVVFQNLC
jgi:hypothetical protein